MNVEQIVSDLKSQGLDCEKILLSLKQMVDEGKLTPEDFEKAKELLNCKKEEVDEEKEKQDAGKLFGLNLI